MIQGYIAVSDDGTEVRLRRIDKQCFQTVKSEGGLVRDEIEVELSQQQFRGTLADHCWTTSRKNQVSGALGGQDSGGRRLSWFSTGLVVAEVEFTSAHESTQFTAPPWSWERSD